VDISYERKMIPEQFYILKQMMQRRSERNITGLFHLKCRRKIKLEPFETTILSTRKIQQFVDYIL
jgi:hypothetical protein